MKTTFTTWYKIAQENVKTGFSAIDPTFKKGPNNDWIYETISNKFFISQDSNKPEPNNFGIHVVNKNPYNIVKYVKNLSPQGVLDFIYNYNKSNPYFEQPHGNATGFNSLNILFKNKLLQISANTWVYETKNYEFAIMNSNPLSTDPEPHLNVKVYTKSKSPQILDVANKLTWKAVENFVNKHLSNTIDHQAPATTEPTVQSLENLYYDFEYFADDYWIYKTDQYDFKVKYKNGQYILTIWNTPTNNNKKVDEILSMTCNSWNEVYYYVKLYLGKMSAPPKPPEPPEPPKSNKWISTDTNQWEYLTKKHDFLVTYDPYNHTFDLDIFDSTIDDSHKAHLNSTSGETWHDIIDDIHEYDPSVKIDPILITKMDPKSPKTKKKKPSVKNINPEPNFMDVADEMEKLLKGDDFKS